MLFSGSLTAMISGAVIVLVTITVHELAHGYTAYLLGDNTAKNAGRLSLNPLAHFAFCYGFRLGKTCADQSVLF